MNSVAGKPFLNVMLPHRRAGVSECVYTHDGITEHTAISSDKDRLQVWKNEMMKDYPQNPYGTSVLGDITPREDGTYALKIRRWASSD